jgi:hypothetical protein
METSPDKLLKSHRALIHSDAQKVLSHVQREEGEWFINTLMLEGCEVPFRYRRKQRYRSLQGARVNLTYYRDTIAVGGFEMEVMKVVRLKRA